MAVNPDIATRLDTELTETDVALIGEIGHDEDTLALLAATHASRTQALLRAIDPASAAKLFILVADRFLKDAQVAQETSIAHA